MTSTSHESAITPRGLEIPDGAGKPFDFLRMARSLLRQGRNGALSTLDPSGYPYGSLTNYAADHDGSPIFFAAGVALHTRNLLADDRVSLTIATPNKVDVLAFPRLTLVGRVRLFKRETSGSNRLAQRYLRKHPKAKLYLSLPDAVIFRMEVEDLQLSGGPGRNAAVVKPRDILTDLTGADSLLEGEEALLDRLHGDAAKVQALAAQAGGKAGRWSAVALDPEGLDLVDGDVVARVWFEPLAKTEAEARAALAL